MRTKYDFGTAERLPTPSPRNFVGGDASDAGTQSPVDRDVIRPAREFLSNPRLVDKLLHDDPPSPKTFNFDPFDEKLDDPIVLPDWEADITDIFADVFGEDTLSTCPIDDVVAHAIHIIGTPTQENIRGLAQAVYGHWLRRQMRSRDANVCSPKTVALIARITYHLGCISVQAENDFVDELNRSCITKLKLTWRWYASVEHAGEREFPIPGATLFKQLMAIITMIGHLFHGGQFQSDVALSGLEYIAERIARTDALVVIHALLRQLGRRFALERAGRCFIQNLLADLLPLTETRSPLEPYCQSVFAISTLAAEWYNSTCGTAYRAYPSGVDQFRAHLLQM